MLLEHLEDQEGSVVLSKKKADFMRVWERIRVAYENDQPVEGTLVKKIKGGVVVDLMGVDAFLPGIADRAPPRAEHRRAARPEVRVQDHQAQQAPPQHRRLAPRDPRERARRQAREADEGARRRTRSGRASSRTSPTSARSSISAASTACSTSPTCRGAASRIRPRWSQIGTELEVKVLDIDWQRERISPRPQAAPDLSVEGRRREVSGRHARPGQGRHRSRTTARSSSSSRASKAWCTSAR